jgi:hypothetical protein
MRGKQLYEGSLLPREEDRLELKSSTLHPEFFKVVVVFDIMQPMI